MQKKDANRKKKSSDDEKLSKRIAAELKVQQEANKKRNRQSGNFENEPTERSALPIMIQPREVGPTFVTSPKSVKSAKSAAIVTQIAENPTNYIHNFGNTANGCLVACFLLGFIYTIAWIYYSVVSRNWLPADIEQASVNSIKWIAITSIAMIVLVPIWFAARHRFGVALLSLLSMIACSVSLLVHLVYYIVIDKSISSSKSSQTQDMYLDDNTTLEPPTIKHYLSERNPLNFWLSITFLLMSMIAVSIMIKQLLNLVSRQIEAKNSSDGSNRDAQDPALSQYMAHA